MKRPLNPPGTLGLAAAAWIAACGGSDHDHGHDHGADAGGHDHAHATAAPTEGGAHDHRPRHGGSLAETEGLHVEAKVGAEGLELWFTDGNHVDLPAGAVSGKAVINEGSGVVEAPVERVGDRWLARAALPAGQGLNAVLAVVVDGRPKSVALTLAPPTLGHHDHSSIHGGEVMMFGDYHVEWTQVDGQHRFWLTDADRKPAQATAATFTDAGGAGTLSFDPALGAWVGAAKGGGPVRVELDSGAVKVQVAFAAKGEGTGHPHGDDAHHHGGEGHGHDKGGAAHHHGGEGHDHAPSGDGHHHGDAGHSQPTPTP